MNGLCITPTEWKELNPSHKSPKKHQPLTHEESLETINAFREGTMTEIRQTQKAINAAWEQMRNYWWCLQPGSFANLWARSIGYNRP